MDEHTTITDLERRLTESETRYRLLIESWAQAEWETDPDGVVVVDSPSWRAYTGQTLDEWLGHGWLDAIHPDDRAYAECQWREAIAARGVINAEFRLRAPDGGWRWTNVRAAPLLDAGSRIEKWVGINIEIDARKRTEAALRESEEKYRTLFETMSQGYTEQEIVRNAEGRAVDHRMLSANPQYERLTGVPLTSALGRTGQEIVPGIESAWIERFERLVATCQPQHFEQEVADLGRWFDVHAYPLGGDRFALLYDNISERKRSEAALRESEERQAFLLKLSDTLRSLADPSVIQLVACRVLGQQLKIDRAYYGETDEAADFARVGPNYLGGEQPSLEGVYRLSEFGWLLPILRSSEMVAVSDTESSALIPHSDRAALTAIGVRAIAVAPLVKEGTLVGCLAITCGEPRHWAEPELELLRETGERTWAALERALAEGALRESEARFQQFAKASAAGLWIREAETLEMEFVSPAISAIYGVEPGELLGGVERWTALIVPEDRDTAFEHLKTARLGEAVVHEFRVQRPWDGAFRWIRNTDFPLHDNGVIRRIGGIAEDVTEAKQTARRLEVLVNELQHRARNLLGVVSSVVGRTLRQGGSVDAFEERLQALSRAQGLLSQAGSDTVELGDLVGAELAAHTDVGSDRVTVSGPMVHLTARQVQNFALAVHELTTNAVKYGALKDGAGQLAVVWDVVLDRRERRRLALSWIESGVAVRRNATPRRGYGTELIQEALAYALEAEVEYMLGEDGVRCRIEMPVS